MRDISSATRSYIFWKDIELSETYSENIDIGYKGLVKKKNKSKQYKNNISLNLL